VSLPFLVDLLHPWKALAYGTCVNRTLAQRIEYIYAVAAFKLCPEKITIDNDPLGKLSA